MATVLQLRPGSDEFEAATCGLVRAERINAVIASPTSKRNREYLRLISRQYQDEPETDPADQFRDDEGRIAMIGQALRLYRDKHEVRVKGGLIYLHDDLPVCACPHGVDNDMILLTVRVKEKRETFEREIDRDVMPDMFRIAQAQMVITGHRYAIEIDCCMDDAGAMELHEKEIFYDKRRAEELLEAMAVFAQKTREEEAA